MEKADPYTSCQPTKHTPSPTLDYIGVQRGGERAPFATNPDKPRSALGFGPSPPSALGLGRDPRATTSAHAWQASSHPRRPVPTRSAPASRALTLHHPARNPALQSAPPDQHLGEGSALRGHAQRVNTPLQLQSRASCPRLPSRAALAPSSLATQLPCLSPRSTPVASNVH